MSDDNYGIVNDPRPGQQQEAEEVAEGCEEANERSCEKPDDCSRADERQGEIACAEAIIDSAPEEIREYLAEAMLVKGWSGLLPDPESFLAYPPEVQQSMVSWNDAKIVDESKRLDKLVDASIEEAKRENTLSFALNVLFLLGSFAAFMITRDPLSFGFLSVPGVTIAVNVWKDRKDSKDQK